MYGDLIKSHFSYEGDTSSTEAPGGLFEINDTAYLLFKEIELNVRKHLLLTLPQKSSNVASSDKQESIISAVTSDDNVQFYWTLLSVDIESEDQAVKLLKEIMGLWLTIRGFSIAGTWMEYCLNDTLTKESKKGNVSAKSTKGRASPKSRNAKDKATNNTKGLRKQLKQKYASQQRSELHRRYKWIVEVCVIYK